MRNVRVFYKKFGRMKFASHLDMNRLMTRLIRLSNIPIWYTEGFNQHPYITFALPLSLGFTSDYEIMDIRITDDEFTDEMVSKALSGVFPEGLEVIGVAPRGKKSGEIGFAEFLITFENADEQFASDLENFLSQESIITLKKTKKGNMKEIDLKPYIKSKEVISDNGITLKIVLSAGGEANINPTLLLSVMPSIPEYTVCRTMIFDNEMECFK